MSKCSDKVVKDLKDTGGLKESETNSILAAMETRVDRTQARNPQSSDEAHLEAASFISEKYTRDSEIAEKNAYNRILIKNRAIKFIKQFDNPLTGLRAYLSGVESTIRGSRHGISQELHQMMRKQMGALTRELIEAGKKGDGDRLYFFNHRSNEAAITKAIANPEGITDPVLLDVAHIVRNRLSEIRKLLRSVGADIAEESEYVVRQSHDRTKLLRPLKGLARNIALRTKLMKENGGDFFKVNKIMRDMGFERWKNFITPLIDADRTFKGLNPAKFLREAFDQITDGKTAVPDDGSGEGLNPFAKGVNLSKKVAASREIHLKKGGDAFVQYNREYGKGSLRAQIDSQIVSGSRNYALLKGLGSNPQAMFEVLNKEAGALAQEKGIGRNKITALLRINNAVMSNLAGPATEVAMNIWGKALEAIRSIKVMSLVGLKLTALTDYAQMAAAMEQFNAGPVDQLTRGVLTSLKFFKSEDHKKILGQLDNMARVTGGSLLARVGGGDQIGGRRHRLPI